MLENMYTCMKQEINFMLLLFLLKRKYRIIKSFCKYYIKLIVVFKIIVFEESLREITKENNITKT